MPYQDWDGKGQGRATKATGAYTTGAYHTEEYETEIPVSVPSPEQLAELNRSASRTLLRSVMVQILAGVLVGVVAWLVAGVAAGVSALAGAAACAIPNVLFALRLLFGMVKPGGASPVTFFLGEFLKLGSTALLLGLAVKLGQDELVWPALLAGLIVALKSHYWLLLFKDS